MAEVKEVKYRKIQLKDLKLGESYGYGQFGEVKKAHWHGKVVAVKSFAAPNRKGGFSEELMCLSILKHEQIVEMFGANTGEQPFIVLEFAPLSLEKVLHIDRKKYKYTADHVMNWAQQLSWGLEYIHSQKMMHRDIKPSNVLLFESGRNLKLCDFGTTKTLENTLNTNAVGTIRYMAPEVIRGRKYTFACDVFSFAVVMWEMVTRRRPTLGSASGGRSANNLSILYAMASGARPPKIKDLPEVIDQLITRCWDEEPDNRPSLQVIKKKLDVLCEKFFQTKPPLIPRRHGQKAAAPAPAGTTATAINQDPQQQQLKQRDTGTAAAQKKSPSVKGAEKHESRQEEAPPAVTPAPHDHQGRNNKQQREEGASSSSASPKREAEPPLSHGHHPPPQRDGGGGGGVPSSPHHQPPLPLAQPYQQQQQQQQQHPSQLMLGESWPPPDVTAAGNLYGAGIHLRSYSATARLNQLKSEVLPQPSTGGNNNNASSSSPSVTGGGAPTTRPAYNTQASSPPEIQSSYNKRHLHHPHHHHRGHGGWVGGGTPIAATPLGTPGGGGGAGHHVLKGGPSWGHGLNPAYTNQQSVASSEYDYLSISEEALEDLYCGKKFMDEEDFRKLEEHMHKENLGKQQSMVMMMAPGTAGGSGPPPRDQQSPPSHSVSFPPRIAGLEDSWQPVPPDETDPESLDVYHEYVALAEKLVQMRKEYQDLKEESTRLEQVIRTENGKMQETKTLVAERDSLMNEYQQLSKQLKELKLSSTLGH